MRRLKTCLLVIGVVVVCLLLGKNLIAKLVLSSGIKAMTGLDTRVASVEVGLLKSAVRIRRLEVLNPPGFPEPVMVGLPELYVAYDLGSLLRGKTHLGTVRLSLQEFNVVRKSDGQLNLRSIKVLESTGPQKGTGSVTSKPAPEFQIDVLELQIGKVVFTDATRSPMLVKEFRINIDERYEHIANPYAFAGLVVSRALIKMTVGQLTNFDVAGLQSAVTQTLKESAGRLTGTLSAGAEQAEQGGKEAAGRAKDVVDQTTGTFKKLLGN